jgi:hypothetical protein
MTRSKKPTASKKLLAAQAAHDKFLRSYGIDPSRKPTLRGVVKNDLVVLGNNRVTAIPPTSDRIPAHGPTRQVFTCDLPIAQPYHKGPLMVVTNFKDLEGSKRRS